MEQSAIVINLTVLLAAALVGGMIAHRLRQPVILGYLIVGAVIGPYSLGLVRDVALVEGAATVGVALLMLTLGLEVSFAQLKQVGRVGLWGGISQIAVTALLGALVGAFVLGWPWPEATLFGLIVSLSSTMVCLKVLMDRGELDSFHGRIMIAMLILQDLTVVLMTAVGPILGRSQSSVLPALGLTLLNVVLFVGIAILVGAWVLPWLMGRVGGVRSRELFLLTVLVVCLGAALGTQTLGLSAVFGAFLIGLVVRETRFAHQALAEITPLRDIFAALFFVSLGMLLDPRFVWANWPLVAITVGVIVLIKALTVFGVLRSFGYGGRAAVLASAGLFQIGEFGFILAQDGVRLGVMSSPSYNLIVACAIVTMLLTPLLMSLASLLHDRLATPVRDSVADSGVAPTTDVGRTDSEVIIAGFGRIGQSVARSLSDAGILYSVIEIDPEVVLKVRCGGIACIYGDASNRHVLAQLGLSRASVLVVTFPDPIGVMTAVRAALTVNPGLTVVARVHRNADREALERMGVRHLISPEYEASLEILRRVLLVTGHSKTGIGRIMNAVTGDSEVAELAQDDREG